MQAHVVDVLKKDFCLEVFNVADNNSDEEIVDGQTDKENETGQQYHREPHSNCILGKVVDKCSKVEFPKAHCKGPHEALSQGLEHALIGRENNFL